MDKKMIIGIAVLLTLLVLGVFTMMCMERIHSDLSRQVAEAARLALAGQGEKAAFLAKDAGKRWEQTYGFTAAVADHSPMDEIDGLFREAEIYGEAGELPNLAACCARLSFALKAMYDAHSFHLRNIL